MNILCLFSVLLVGVATGYPRGYPARGYQPQRALMFGGYYSNPIFGRSREYVPQGAMTAFVTREAVATNAFSGNMDEPGTGHLPLEDNEAIEHYTERAPQQHNYQNYKPNNNQPEVVLTHEIPQQNEEQVPEFTLGEDVASVAQEQAVANADEVVRSTEATPVARATKRTPKRRKPVKQEQEDEEEESDDSAAPGGWPFAGAKGVPSYNAFFPITIAGGAGSRSRQAGAAARDEDEYYPGSATAIANSFSTGKGGIATSHATSFGDPYLASMLRRGLINFKSNSKNEE